MKVRLQFHFCLMMMLLFSVSVSAQMSPFSFSSPRSMALGGVQSTGFSDASNTIMNPASMPKIEQNQVMVTGNLQMANVTFSSNDYSDSESETTLSTAPFIGGALNLGTRLVVVGASLSTFDHFSIAFPNDATQRYQGERLNLYSASLDLAVGFIPIPDFSFGVKIGLLSGIGEWERSQSPFGMSPGADSQYDTRWKTKLFSDADYNLSLGTIWSPSYRFELGFTYRPPLAYHFDTDLDVQLPASMGGNLFSSSVKQIRVTIPQEARLGFHWIATERIDLYLDGVWTQYSQVKDFDMNMDNPHLPVIPRQIFVPIQMKDSWQIHSGIEILATNFLTFRMGGFYCSKILDPAYESVVFPGGIRYGATTGLGIQWTRINIDIGVGHSIMPDHVINGSKLPFGLDGNVSMNDSFGSVSMAFYL